jgi:CO/xanthine dehydrogenase Mo-binding subunit
MAAAAPGRSLPLAPETVTPGGLSSPYSVVGDAHPRLESLEKVTGRAEYIEDLEVPGALVAKVVRGPWPHARIRHLDTRPALRVPGVVAVITAADTPGRPWGPFIKDQPVLADGVVRYVGEEVAAVAAVDEESAIAGAAAVIVDYEPLPAALDIVSALAPGAPRVHAEREDNIVLTHRILHGDVDEAMRAADAVVEGSFDWPHQYHAYLEPIGTLAIPHPRGRLTVHMNSWSPFMSRDEMAPAMGLRASDLRIIQPVVGGSFGGKVCDDNNALICGLLALRAGRPVRFIHTREEEFLASRPRERGTVWLRLGVTRDGRILAKDCRVQHDNGAYTGKSPAVLGVTMKRCDYAYRMGAVRGIGHLVYTHTVPSGSMRGFGNPEGAFAMESVLDMAAAQIGMDPLELRLRNAARPGDVSVHGPVLRSCGYAAALQQVRKSSDWDRRRHGGPGSSGAGPVRRGIGVGAAAHVAGKRHFGDWDGAVALVHVDLDGTVRLTTGIGDTGNGADTVLAQMLAEVLGCSLDDVRVSPADTEISPYNHGTHASRTTYIGGNAVIAAAEEVRRQLAEVAAAKLGVPADRLVFADSAVRVRGEDARGATLRELAQAALYRRDGRPVIGVGTWDPPTVITDGNQYGNESGAYSFAVQAAEVEVDVETGQVRVLSVWSAVDCGTVINPLLARGQVAGGLQNALGLALSEDVPFVAGAPAVRNLDGYRIPAACDMPALHVDWVPDPEPTHGVGAKGLGELVIAPIGAAVANAVAHATGMRVTSLPLSAEKVLTALSGAPPSPERQREGGPNA